MLIGLFAMANKKVIRLDVPMDEVLGVQIFDPAAADAAAVKSQAEYDHGSLAHRSCVGAQHNTWWIDIWLIKIQCLHSSWI